MPTLNELRSLIKSRSGWVKWEYYMQAHMNVKEYIPLSQLQSEIRTSDPEDVLITMRLLEIAYATLDDTRASLFAKKKKKDDLELLGSILETFQAALLQIRQKPTHYSKWSGYF